MRQFYVSLCIKVLIGSVLNKGFGLSTENVSKVTKKRDMVHHANVDRWFPLETLAVAFFFLFLVALKFGACMLCSLISNAALCVFML